MTADLLWPKTQLIVIAIISIVLPLPSSAQPYPIKPIRFIVPFAPGGGTDIVARTLSARLSGTWGQPVIVDNRTGGGTTIGTGVAAASAPDGYTLVLVASTFAADAALYPQLPYHPLRSFTPIALLTTFPFVLAAHPSVGASSVKELVTIAKAAPGRLNYASGSGSAPARLGMELFKLLAGVDIVGIPYKGAAPAVTALLAGETQLLFTTLPQSVPHIRSGKVRALGISAPQRYPLVPDLPSIGETIPGYDFTSWHGLLAPAGTSKQVVDKVNAEVLRALQDPDIRERLQKLGLDVAGTTPDAFAGIIRAEVAKWSKVVKETGMRAD
jgi:tripartite-type tricarboxylate transporter receptor subunit TctC